MIELSPLRSVCLIIFSLLIPHWAWCDVRSVSCSWYSADRNIHLDGAEVYNSLASCSLFIRAKLLLEKMNADGGILAYRKGNESPVNCETVALKKPLIAITLEQFIPIDAKTALDSSSASPEDKAKSGQIIDILQSELNHTIQNIDESLQAFCSDGEGL